MILSFDKISKNDAGKAGGKGASLGEMTQAGIAIPPGFVVLAETFEEFVDSNNLRAEIQTILGELDHNNVGSIEHASEKIQELIRSGLISEKIQKEIQKYTKTIKTDFVAVRSSATAEDGAEHAWAGQLDTYLNVPKTDIITKIQSCWASLFTPRALFYRSEKGLGDLHISVAVVVQSMVDAESAGVAFSVHPVTENTDEIVIEGSWGLGEAVVSGEVTPDSFVISKASGEIISQHIAEKKKGIWRNTNGENEWRNIEKHEQQISILSRNKLLELAKLIIKIENHYGFPCDIEWAHSKDQIYILQARPITTLSQDFSFSEKISIPEGIRTFTWEPWLQRLWGAFMLSFSEQSFTPTNIQNAGFGSLSMEAMLFQKGMWYYSQEVFDRMDADLERYFMSHSIFDLTQSLSHFMHQSEIRIKELIVSNASLHQKFEEVYNIMSTAMTFIWITHSIESYYNKKLQIEVPKYVTTDIDTFIGDASFPIKPNLHMMLDGMIRDGKTSQEIVDKAGWVKVRDGFSAPYTVQEIDEMRRHISPLQNNKKITVPEPLKALFEQIQELVFFRTERTDVFYYLFFLARPIIQEMGFQYGISFQEMKYYRATSFLDGVPEKYSDKVSFGYYHGESIFQEMPILVESSSNILDEDAPIRGVIAFRGKIQGKVKIVTHTSQLDKVNVGDILVTQMTFPSFISAMHRASAFVTDEGGITCHAAIIARELKKPCIIGTKNATQILKDGDLVEVDAENGIVKIIERKENFLENKKLEVWIERKQSIFSMTVFHELESKIMSEHLGGGFKTQICFMKNEVCSYIHEIGDLEKVIDNIARNLQTSSDKERAKFTIEMNQWEKIGKKIIKDGPEVVLQSEEAMREYLENYKNIGYWTTAVPYFLLEAIHTLQEQKRYKRLQKICERLRSNSLYPILNENITIKVLNHISLKSGLTQADAYYITWYEAIQCLNGEIPKNIENIQQRKNKHNAFYRGKNGEIVFLESEKDIQILSRLVYGKTNDEVVQGKKCYPGKITGRVKILKTREDIKEFQEGDILVSPNSNPSLMPCIKKCSAIITDEGGVSCHAAIISRELKIPCIIGTRNATKILKDGDLVEVDAENGVVKILSRSKYSLEGKQFLSEGGRACYLYPNRIFCTRAKIPHPLWENDITVISTSENHKVNWYFAVQDESEFDYTLERVLAKNSMLQEGEKEINKVVEKAKRTFKKEYKNRQDAWNGYRNFIKIYEEIGIVPTFMRQLDRAVVRSLHQSKLSEEDFAIATYPTKRTYQRQEEVLILELRTKFEDKITVEIEKKIDEIYKQYYTASLGYFEETVKAKKDYYDMLLGFPKSQAENHLKKIIREEKEMQEKKIKLKKSFPGKASVIDIAGFIVYLKDHYKFQVNKVQHYAEGLFKSISNLTGYDEGLIRDMTPEEIHDLLLKNKINKEEIDKRIAYHAYICNHQNESQLVIGEEAKKFSKRYLATNNKQNCFSGRIACKGRGVGKAKIILGTRDFSKMEEGDILVVMNTSPDFVPIMRKAAAIVAEEGGITGHVSVVSREFGIPSVVGIKQVTSIIDDGDLVEVDAENGVVKILERKENISWAFTYDRQMSYQRINLFHYGYCERLSQYFDVKIENELYRIKDGLVSVFYDEPGHKKAFEKIRNLLTGEERAEWYKKIYKTITQDYREFISFLDKGERKHLKNKPSHTLREYMKHNRKISLSTWLLYSYIEEILSDVFQEIIQQKGIRNWKEIFHTLSQPDQMLPSDEWEYDVVQTAILAKEKQLGRIEKLALKYRSYGMYDVMFHGKSQKDIEKKVKETTQESAKQILKNIEKKYKQQKKELEKIKNIKWNKDEKSLLKLYRLYANFKDWKNFHRERSSYQIGEVYSEIAEKYPLLEEEMLYYMREDEILTGIEKNKWPSKKDILRRKENSALLFLRNREENITDISKLEELDKQTSIHKNSITGVTAYPGKVTGKAHIINSHKDLKKLKKGEIMISSTTRPDYLPFMQDIGGFITNEGGVLSHAAILAREIKKPCIIGTKVATQAIKTGDIICLDGERGIVDLLS